MSMEFFTLCMHALSAVSFSYVLIMLYERYVLNKRYKSNRISVSQYKQSRNMHILGCKVLLIIWIAFLLVSFLLLPNRG